MNSRPVARGVSACAIMAAMLLTGLGHMRSAQALPSWSRKYNNVPCSTCHSMAFPKLNKMGFLFRRLGYRLPAEVAGKPPEAAGTTEGATGATEGGTTTTAPVKVDFTNYLSFANRFEYRGQEPAFHTNPGGGPEESRSSGGFRYHDVKLFGAGPVVDNWAIFVEANLGDEGGFGLAENAFMQYRTGNDPLHFGTVKIGQFHTLDGIGPFDRPLDALGRPVPITQQVNGFALNQDQRGIQLGYTSGDSHILGSIMNGLNSEGEGIGEDLGGRVQDTNSGKDVLLQGYHIFDKQGSSIGAYYYRGKTRFSDTFQDSFHQIGVGGQYFINPKLPVQAVYAMGTHDKLAGGTFDDRSFQVEAAYATGKTSNLIAKYGHFKVDAGRTNPETLAVIGDGKFQNYSLGWQTFISQHARVSLEYTHRKGSGTFSDVNTPLAEIWFTF